MKSVPEVRFPMRFVHGGHFGRAGKAGGVYISLLSHADSDGWCFPGEDTIARECGTTDKTVRRHLAALLDIGFLLEMTKRGSNNHYRIAMPSALMGSIPDKMTGATDKQGTELPDRSKRPEGTKRPVILTPDTGQNDRLTYNNNLLGTSTAHGREGEPDIAADFERFWESYPKKEHRDGARGAKTAYNMATREGLPSIEELLTILEKHKAQASWDNVRFVPQASKWLNDRRWTDVIPDEPAKKSVNPNKRDNSLEGMRARRLALEAEEGS